MKLYAAEPAQPTGVRPTIVTALRADMRADGFLGLPAGISRWRLAAALRTAARLLDLSAPMLRLLEHYIDCTYDIDWTPGNEPIITRPLTETATCLDRSERQIRNIERALAERGLLAWRDSGNHHRRGQRDRKTGQLVYAYGPTLAPLGAQADRIIALATQARSELAALRRSRLAISALRRRLHSALNRVNGIETDHHEAVAAMNVRLPARLSLEHLEQHRERLRALTTTYEAMIQREDDRQTACPSAKAEILCRPITNTETENSIKEYDDKLSTEIMQPATHHWLDINTAHAAAGPTVREFTTDHRTWDGLIEATAQSAIMIGIDQTLWQRGCQIMGPIQTALTVLIMERAALRNKDDPWPPLRHPRAYFHGILKRHTTGTLHLDRSIRHLARTGPMTMWKETNEMRQTQSLSEIRGRRKL